MTRDVQCPGVSHQDGRRARLAQAMTLESQLSCQSPVPPSSCCASGSAAVSGVSGRNRNGLIISHLAGRNAGRARARGPWGCGLAPAVERAAGPQVATPRGLGRMSSGSAAKTGLSILVPPRRQPRPTASGRAARSARRPASAGPGHRGPAGGPAAPSPRPRAGLRRRGPGEGGMEQRDRGPSVRPHAVSALREKFRSNVSSHVTQPPSAPITCQEGASAFRDTETPT